MAEGEGKSVGKVVGGGGTRWRSDGRAGRRTKERERERRAGAKSRTKIANRQVHVQGENVERWPGVTSIKDGLPSVARSRLPQPERRANERSASLPVSRCKCLPSRTPVYESHKSLQQIQDTTVSRQ